MNTSFELIEPAENGAVIKVIGVGGCGGNALEHMMVRGLSGVEFICANTDAQSLKRSSAPIQLQLGSTQTRGLGAGARPEVGRNAALSDRDRLVELIRGADMLFITAGMGGGTGTGAAPVIAEIAKEMDILTVAVVTKPFLFEGTQCMKVAQAGIEELAKKVDSLIVVPNEKLRQVLGKVTFKDARAAANDVLYNAVSGIAEVIHTSGDINVDFQDVRTVMGEVGMAMMGSATARGADRARNAAEAAVKSPLLEDVNLKGAHGVLVNITASSDFDLDELYETMETIREFTAEDAMVLFGQVTDESMGDNLRVTIIATGLDSAARQRQPKLEVVETVLERTGTDGGPASDAIDYDQPTVTRRRVGAPGSSAASFDASDIPAFLRKQAD
ncbi:MAG: cell division protein FtsZ [Burkholderiales bacterium]|nr:cell division protein FtsZ [Burkholderiales bacterium]